MKNEEKCNFWDFLVNLYKIKKGKKKNIINNIEKNIFQKCT